MSVDARVHLPHHVSAKWLHQFIARCVGMPDEKQSFPDRKTIWTGDKRQEVEVPRPFDPSLPSSKENAWYVGVHDRSALVQEAGMNGKDLSHGQLRFQDLAGGQYQWFYHLDTEEENTRLLSMNASTTGIAVGRRVVEMFGGTFIADDTCDTITKRVAPKSARFPPKTREQSNDDRWYQFQNCLAATPVLTPEELRAAQAQSAYHTDRDAALLRAVEALANAAALAAVLEDLPEETPMPRAPKMRL